MPYLCSTIRRVCSFSYLQKLQAPFFSLVVVHAPMFAEAAAVGILQVRVQKEGFDSAWR